MIFNLFVIDEEILTTGLAQLGTRCTKYRKYQRYYDGKHDLAFSTKKFLTVLGGLFKTFCDNLMPAAITGVTDNLQVEIFNFNVGKTDLSETAWRIWQDKLVKLSRLVPG